MKKFKLIILSILCSILLITPLSTPIHAENIKTYEDLFEEYGLKDAEIIPDGVTPIVINSPQELEALLSSFNTSSIDGIVSIESNSRSVVTRTVTVSYPTSGIVPYDGAANVNLRVAYDLYSSGSFTGIQAIRYSQWTLTGNTTGLELENSITDHTLTNGIIDVIGTTTVNLYVVISGLIKYKSADLTAGYKYEPRQGVYNKFSQVTNN